MNIASSPAHTFIMLELKQIMYKDDQKFEKVSVINFIDLAGAERISKAGVNASCLKEGNSF
jgi:hypothetical protein